MTGSAATPQRSFDPIYVDTESKSSRWSPKSSLEKKLLKFLLIAIFFICLLVSALIFILMFQEKSLKSLKDQYSKEELCSTPACTRIASILMDSMNVSADPCDDFYEYACGNFERNNPIPDEKGVFGVFDIISHQNMGTFKEILEEPVKETDPEYLKKIKTFFVVCIDEEKLSETSIPALEAMLDRFGGWPIISATWSENTSTFDFTSFEAISSREWGNSLMDISVWFDGRNSTINKIYVDQSDVVLGRDYLLDPEKYEEKIAAYKNLIHNVALTLGQTDESLIMSDVEAMVTFETEIAKILSPPEERRDLQKQYNPMTVEELQKLTNTTVDWVRLFNIIFDGLFEIPLKEVVIVQEPRFIKDLIPLLNKTPDRTFVNYMLWNRVFPVLSEMGGQMHFHKFQYDTIIKGIKRPRERWQNCIRTLDHTMGMALGREFVAQTFGNDSKLKASEMIEDIHQSFSEMLQQVKWMDEETKAAATDKAKKMNEMIGYPDWILNNTKLNEYYEDVTISEESHLRNVYSVVHAQNIRNLKILRDVPADRSRWLMSPAMVNANYLSSANSITITAGILQFPIFHRDNPMSVNFGEIGAAIGHEITHGFDDEGRQSDGDGNLRDWWSKEMVNNFQEKTKCLDSLYSGFCPEKVADTKICINGIRTMGENIADVGGVKASFKAYKSWIERNGEEPRLPGLSRFSGEQIFFLSYANLWCTAVRKEMLLMLMLTDSHSPGKYRVLGPLINSEDFAKAFKCSADSKMTAKNQCVVW